MFYLWSASWSPPSPLRRTKGVLPDCSLLVWRGCSPRNHPKSKGTLGAPQLVWCPWNEAMCLGFVASNISHLFSNVCIHAGPVYDNLGSASDLYIHCYFFLVSFKACCLKPTHVFIFWLFGSFKIQINDVQCFVKWPVGMNASRNVWIAAMQMCKFTRNSALKLSCRERAESCSLQSSEVCGEFTSDMVRRMPVILVQLIVLLNWPKFGPVKFDSTSIMDWLTSDNWKGGFPEVEPLCLHCVLFLLMQSSSRRCPQQW